MDVCDGKVKKGQELSCGRTKRCEPRHSEKDLRSFRGHKVSRGRRVVRKNDTIYGPERSSCTRERCTGPEACITKGHASYWITERASLQEK